MKQAPAVIPYLKDCFHLREHVVYRPGRDRRRLSLHQSFLLAALIAVLLPVTVRAQQPPTIQWELVNPFRFIHDQETIDDLRTIYAGLNEKSAFALEQKLQQLADLPVDNQRAAARKQFDCNRPKSDAERRQCFAPYLGWFKRLAENNHARTCWDSDKRKFRKDGPCKDYIYPKSHRVRVWITNLETVAESIPQWTLTPALKSEPCQSKSGRRFCIEFDVDYRADNPQQVRVTAQFPSLSLPIDIQVNDKLIVGLGDSYAAGEGNPDRPVQFSEGEDELDFLTRLILGKFEIVRSPQSNGEKAAWLDRRCHRSMYSYQFKTALQLALDNPKEAITYVTFSCAGATTDEIIDVKQKSIEGGGELQPQLVALREALANGPNHPREIDFLLLSTGGNDIGFGGLVSFVVLPTRLLGVLKRFGISEGQIIADHANQKFRKELLTKNDCGNYRRLQKALLGGEQCPPQKEIPDIRIKGCNANQPCPRILLTPYPDVFLNESNQLCDGKREEFDRPFTRDPTRDHRIKIVSKHVVEQIRNVQRDAIVTGELGWKLIDGNVTAYAGHGFCALNAGSTSKTAEKFLMPNKKDGKWDSFDPWEYRAYETRQRWMRLPVDAKLSTNQVRVLLKLKIDLFLEDDRSNIMHPTAEGLARTADLNVLEIRKIEPIPIPQ